MQPTSAHMRPSFLCPHVASFADPPDNAANEGFFGRLKTRRFYPRNRQDITIRRCPPIQQPARRSKRGSGCRCDFCLSWSKAFGINFQRLGHGRGHVLQSVHHAIGLHARVGRVGAHIDIDRFIQLILFSPEPLGNVARLAHDLSLRIGKRAVGADLVQQVGAKRRL